MFLSNACGSKPVCPRTPWQFNLLGDMLVLRLWFVLRLRLTVAPGLPWPHQQFYLRDDAGPAAMLYTAMMPVSHLGLLAFCCNRTNENAAL